MDNGYVEALLHEVRRSKNRMRSIAAEEIGIRPFEVDNLLNRYSDAVNFLHWGCSIATKSELISANEAMPSDDREAMTDILTTDRGAAFSALKALYLAEMRLLDSEHNAPSRLVIDTSRALQQAAKADAHQQAKEELGRKGGKGKANKDAHLKELLYQLTIAGNFTSYQSAALAAFPLIEKAAIEAGRKKILSRDQCVTTFRGWLKERGWTPLPKEGSTSTGKHSTSTG